MRVQGWWPETNGVDSMKYKIRKLGAGFELLHPDGYWIGPGLGYFDTIADAMNWLTKSIGK
jgi:hypothetical protein